MGAMKLKQIQLIYLEVVSSQRRDIQNGVRY